MIMKRITCSKTYGLRDQVGWQRWRRRQLCWPSERRVSGEIAAFTMKRPLITIKGRAELQRYWLMVMCAFVCSCACIHTCAYASSVCVLLWFILYYSLDDTCAVFSVCVAVCLFTFSSSASIWMSTSCLCRQTIQLVYKSQPRLFTLLYFIYWSR